MFLIHFVTVVRHATFYSATLSNRSCFAVVGRPWTRHESTFKQVELCWLHSQYRTHCVNSVHSWTIGCNMCCDCCGPPYQSAHPFHLALVDPKCRSSSNSRTDIHSSLPSIHFHFFTFTFRIGVFLFFKLIFISILRSLSITMSSSLRPFLPSILHSSATVRVHRFTLVWVGVTTIPFRVRACELSLCA